MSQFSEVWYSVAESKIWALGKVFSVLLLKQQHFEICEHFLLIMYITSFLFLLIELWIIKDKTLDEMSMFLRGLFSLLRKWVICSVG